MSRIGVMLCGHGSRSEAAVDEFAVLAQKLPALLPADWMVDYGYLEFANPVIRDGLDRLRQAGCDRILAVPGMLFAAMHAKNDIPSVLNAYALGIGRIRGRMWVLVAFLLATIVPQEALLYPLYIMFKHIGLYDTIWSVIVVFIVIHGAFGTYLLASVFGSFPKELLEAAALDGANRRQILWRVVVPVVRPTLAVLAVFFFIWTWNEFLIPLSFLVSADNQTVQVGIATLQGERIMNVTTISASALLGVAPTLLFFLVFQRTLTRGLTAGAIK